MKNIIAILNQLEQQLAQLNLETVSAIERDLALEKLRNIYDLLLGVTTAAEEQEPLAESVIELIEELVDEVEEFDNAEEENTPEEPAEVAEELAQEEPEESVIELIEDLVEEVEEFDNSEDEVAEVAEPEPEPEQEPEQEPEPEIEVRPKTKLAHSAILALYDDEEEDETEEEVTPAEEETNAVEEVTDEEPEEVVIDMTEPIVEVEPETTEPAPAVEPVAEPAAAEEEEEQPVKVVLGEVLGADQTTLADRIAADAPADVASVANAQKSLVEMIGLNDKFILLRDLFHNNHDYYEAAIDQLDEFEDIDEAMLFIHDNFQWNPNSEGAKLLVELLSNKLL